jgi:hypothetical protein
MKLIYLTFATVLLFPMIGKSQISIVSNDLPDAGDNILVTRAIDFLIDYQSTGPNHTWDFPQLAQMNQTNREHFSLANAPVFIKVQYGPLASSKYKANYYMPYTDLPLNQFGNILPLNIGDVFQYTQKTASKVNLVGYSASINGQGIPIKSDTIETKYKLPLNYGDSYTSKGFTKLDLSMVAPAKWQQKRYRETVVDGWGTIVTPHGSYEALRVHHRVEETDSLEFQGNTFGLDIPVMHEYEWLTKDEKIAVLKVRTTEILGNETVIAIEYIDNPMSVAKVGLENQVVVFPNPVDNQLTIQSAEGLNEVNIQTIEGVVVETFAFSGVQYTVATDHLAAGMYILTLNNNGISINKHFIKQ